MNDESTAWHHWVFATGIIGLLTWFVFWLPWFPYLGGRSSPKPLSLWLFWGIVSAIGIGIVVAFLRWSLLAHWRAMCQNVPMPVAAWRGVCGPYLLLTSAFALSAFASFNPVERFLYIVLASFCLLLSAVAARRSIHGAPRSISPTAT